MTQLNLYGDQKVEKADGHGVDVATQRADDLDQSCLDYLRELRVAGSTSVAMDVGCGMGGQSFRMATEGARVVGLDIVDFGNEFADLMKKAESVCSENGVEYAGFEFNQASMCPLPESFQDKYTGQVDALISQRAIHYIPYADAECLVRSFHVMLKDGGYLYLSASGIGSELGDGYAHKDLPPAERFSMLREDMAEKHGILNPVCLYSVEELADLVRSCGFRITKSFASAFGNIKIIAQK